MKWTNTLLFSSSAIATIIVVATPFIRAQNNGALNNFNTNNSFLVNNSTLNNNPNSAGSLNSATNNTLQNNTSQNTAPIGNTINSAPAANNSFAPINAVPMFDNTLNAAPNTSNKRNGIGQAPVNHATRRQNLNISNSSIAVDSQKGNFTDDVRAQFQKRLQTDLDLYCLDYCNVLSITPIVSEVYNTAQSNLGFENNAAGSQRRFRVDEIKTEIMIDERFGGTNIERIKKLFNKLVTQYPGNINIKWTAITFPDSENLAKSEAQVRSDFNDQVRNHLQNIVSNYCPKECEIHNVDVMVDRANIDEVKDGSASRYLFVRNGKGALFIRGVDVRMSLNALMDNERRERIETLIKQQLLLYGNVRLSMADIPFPKSAEEIAKDRDAERNDPFGLEKLARALDIFKQHANTKEIIRESASSSESINSSNNTESSQEKSLLERLNDATKETLQSTLKENVSKENTNKESNSSSNNSEFTKDDGKTFWTTENTLIVGGIALALVIATMLGLRLVVTGKRMQAIIHEGSPGGGGRHRAGRSNATFSSADDHDDEGSQRIGRSRSNRSEVRQSITIDTLRGDLIEVFHLQPKIARHLFARVIRENGIEYTAKCVVIFGEEIVFELLKDDDLKGDVATLAEYLHINIPDVDPKETLDILRALKLKVSASKIKMKYERNMEAFEFLKSMSAQQVFELIDDESSRSQSVVLTQLSAEKRRVVFDMFEGQAKVELLKALSNQDVISKDYLNSVAQAFAKKAASSPRFDNDNVRGTDVLVELMERADLDAQRVLMQELDLNNPDTAWGLRNKLVTIETLPFLKDSSLIDIFLTLDSDVMSNLLAGARPHIKQLIMAKAPSDLADSWGEMLDERRTVDIDSYRLAELQVLAKMRSLVASGSVQLAEINQIIYPPNPNATGRSASGKSRVYKINQPLVA